jgi:tRNA(Ile)-lysidine synthase
LHASVLLGHTLDDQAETVLLGLGRGSGPRSIAGMRPVSRGLSGSDRLTADGGAADGGAADGGVRYLRPFLGIRRRTTEAACTALGLEPWQDPHNADPSFQRVRLRREVLPLLEDVLQGGVAEALARTAALLRDDLDALDALAAFDDRDDLDELAALDAPAGRPVADAPDPSGHAAETGGAAETVDVAAVAALPRAIRSRALRAWARRQGAGPLTAGHSAALDALVTAWHGQGPVFLPGGLRVSRASGKLVVDPPPPDRQE